MFISLQVHLLTFLVESTTATELAQVIGNDLHQMRLKTMNEIKEEEEDETDKK